MSVDRSSQVQPDVQDFVGPVEDSATMTYLLLRRRRACFVNFKNVCDSTRIKIPFGIAQMGKAFRNEITPKQFVFRSCEFELMEIEFFCNPSESMEWFNRWRQERLDWYKSLGVRADNLRFHDYPKEELAHYSQATKTSCTTIHGAGANWREVAHRGDYDLQQHMKASGKDLSYFNGETKERFVPHVIEPAAGATRALLVFLIAGAGEAPSASRLDHLFGEAFDQERPAAPSRTGGRLDHVRDESFLCLAIKIRKILAARFMCCWRS